MKEMKTLNGYEVVDTQARSDIEVLKNKTVDLTGYATETYVQEQIEAIPDPDLSQYYTKTEIDNKNYLTTLPEHEHDQYLTEHQSLDNYYTKTEVDTALTEVESPPEVYVGTDEPTDENIKIWVDPSNTTEYALKSDIPTDDHINSLIDAKLGVIANGTY